MPKAPATKSKSTTGNRGKFENGSTEIAANEHSVTATLSAVVFR